MSARLHHNRSTFNSARRRQQLLENFVPGRLAHAWKVDANSFACMPDQGAIRKSYRDLGIARPESVLERAILDWFAHQELEKRDGGSSLARVTPWYVQNVVR